MADDDATTDDPTALRVVKVDDLEEQIAAADAREAEEKVTEASPANVIDAADRFINLDYSRFEAEVETKPFKLVGLFGQDWIVPGPGQLPAKVALGMQKALMHAAIEMRERQTTNFYELSEDVLQEMAQAAGPDLAAALLGEDNLEALYAKGMNEAQLNEIVRDLQARHMAAQQEIQKSAEPAPKDETPKAKKSGRKRNKTR